MTTNKELESSSFLQTSARLGCAMLFLCPCFCLIGKCKEARLRDLRWNPRVYLISPYRRSHRGDYAVAVGKAVLDDDLKGSNRSCDCSGILGCITTNELITLSIHCATAQSHFPSRVFRWQIPNIFFSAGVRVARFLYHHSSQPPHHVSPNPRDI